MKSLPIKALIFASKPPPVGGIASIVAMLHKGLSHREDISFVSPATKEKGVFSALLRPGKNLYRLIGAIFRVKKQGRILIFSSEAGSF